MTNSKERRLAFLALGWLIGYWMRPKMQLIFLVLLCLLSFFLGAYFALKMEGMPWLSL